MKETAVRRDHRPWAVAAAVLTAAVLGTATIVAPTGPGEVRAFASGVPVGAVSITDEPYNAVGDGVADDTAAFQAAAASGATVFVPPGTYRVNQQVDVSSNTELTGVASARVILAPSAKFFGDGVSSVVLRGFTITREEPKGTYAVQFAHSNGITIDSMRFIGTQAERENVWFGGTPDSEGGNTGSFDIRITDNVFLDYGTQLAATAYFGTAISVKETRGFVVANNQARYSEPLFSPSSTTVSFQGSAIEIVNSLDGAVTGNEVEFAGQGIDIGGDSGHGSRSVTVTGNSITDSYIAGIKLVNGASFSTVSGNTVVRSGLVGIWVVPGNTAAEDQSVVQGNVITGNQVRDSGSGPGLGAWGENPVGIAIERATSEGSRPINNSITSNVVTDAGGQMRVGVTDRGVTHRGYEEHCTGENVCLLSTQNLFAMNLVSGGVESPFDFQSPTNWTDGNVAQTAAPAAEPGTVAAPSLTVGDADITVSWTAPSSGATATGYDVRLYGEDGEVASAQVAGDVLSTSFARPGTGEFTAAVTVRAGDATGAESEHSATAVLDSGPAVPMQLVVGMFCTDGSATVTANVRNRADDEISVVVTAVDTTSDPTAIPVKGRASIDLVPGASTVPAGTVVVTGTRVTDGVTYSSVIERDHRAKTCR